MDYAEQLKCPEWEERREQILYRDNYKCVTCGSAKSLHVHHKKYDKRLLAWEYDGDYLETLCSVCHDKVHKENPVSFFFTNKFVQ